MGHVLTQDETYEVDHWWPDLLLLKDVHFKVNDLSSQRKLICASNHLSNVPNRFLIHQGINVYERKSADVWLLYVKYQGTSKNSALSV